MQQATSKTVSLPPLKPSKGGWQAPLTTWEQGWGSNVKR
jgi:hypothetical protein